MTIVPRITCANLRKSSRPVTAIGVKGQRNNNRGGGRRPGFEATSGRFAVASKPGLLPQFRTQLRAPTIKCVGGKTEGEGARKAWTIFARDACLDYHNASCH